MSEIKVSLSITLPGRVLLSQEDAKLLEEEKTGMGFDVSKVRVETYKKGKKKVDFITIKTRKCYTATQCINLGLDAYLNMISSEGIAPGFKHFQWNNMTKKQRLEAHLNIICAHLGGLSYTYKVFDE